MDWGQLAVCVNWKLLAPGCASCARSGRSERHRFFFESKSICVPSRCEIQLHPTGLSSETKNEEDILYLFFFFFSLTSENKWKTEEFSK